MVISCKNSKNTLANIWLAGQKYYPTHDPSAPGHPLLNKFNSPCPWYEEENKKNSPLYACPVHFATGKWKGVRGEVTISVFFSCTSYRANVFFF